MFRAITLMLLSACPYAQGTDHYLSRIEPVRANFSMETMTDAEKQIGGEHFAYMKKLMADGKIIFGGQALDPKGMYGIVIYKAASEDEARSLMNGDPAVKGKLLKAELVPFRVMLDHGAAAEHGPAH